MMPSKQTQAGFSILELLISLLLGLVVIAGIVQLFVGNSRTYEIVTAQCNKLLLVDFADKIFSLLVEVFNKQQAARHEEVLDDQTLPA